MIAICFRRQVIFATCRMANLAGVRTWLTPILLFFACSPVAFADPLDFFYDQRNPKASTADISINGLKPVGQEFVPKLKAVEVVTVPIEGDSQILGRMDGSFTVRIHKDTIGGDVLGTSQQVDLPATWGLGQTVLDQLVRFDFAAAVALVPGNRYVFELVQSAGTNFTVRLSGDTYGQGRLVSSGTPDETRDIIFWEGVKAAPEPASLSLLSLGTLSLLGFGLWRRKVAVSAKPPP